MIYEQNCYNLNVKFFEIFFEQCFSRNLKSLL